MRHLGGPVVATSALTVLLLATNASAESTIKFFEPDFEGSTPLEVWVVDPAYPEGNIYVVKWVYVDGQGEWTPAYPAACRSCCLWNVTLTADETTSDGVKEHTESACLSPSKDHIFTMYFEVPLNIAAGKYRLVVKNNETGDSCSSPPEIEVEKGMREETEEERLGDVANAEKVYREVFETEYNKRRQSMAGINLKPLEDIECSIDTVTSVKDFGERVLKNEPVVLRGSPEAWMDDVWSFDNLIQNNLTKHGVRVSGISEVEDILIPLANWARFTKEQTKYLDKPPKVSMEEFFNIYPEMAEHARLAGLLAAAGVENLLAHVDGDLVDITSLEMAPWRSGTGWEVNQFNTSRVVGVLEGKKVVGIFDRSVKHVTGALHNDHTLRNDQDSIPFYWWHYTRHALMKSGLPTGECVLNEGDVLYVPSGSWYSDLNLAEVTMATELSVCHHGNVAECLREARLQADTSDSNYYGEVAKSLEHFLRSRGDQFKELLDAEGEFIPPVAGDGVTAVNFFAQTENLAPLFHDDGVDISSEVLAREMLPRLFPDVTTTYIKDFERRIRERMAREQDLPNVESIQGKRNEL